MNQLSCSPLEAEGQGIHRHGNAGGELVFLSTYASVIILVLVTLIITVTTVTLIIMVAIVNTVNIVLEVTFVYLEKYYAIKLFQFLWLSKFHFSCY